MSDRILISWPEKSGNITKMCSILWPANVVLLHFVIYMFWDVYRNFGPDWQYNRSLIIQHSLLSDISWFKNIITFTTIHSTTVILHQQSTKHVTKWIILSTPLLCLHFSYLHICAWIWGTKGPYIRPRCIGAARSRTLIQSTSTSTSTYVLAVFIVYILLCTHC
jgi:hypothetical protein